MTDLVQEALMIAELADYGNEEHKMWVIDQMVKALTGCTMTATTRLATPNKVETIYKETTTETYENWVGDRDHWSTGTNLLDQ